MKLLLDEERAQPDPADFQVIGGETEFFSDIDLHFARLMQKLCGVRNRDLMLASALVSRYTRQGHICINLQTYAGSTLRQADGSGLQLECPDLVRWRSALEPSPVIGVPGEYKPMILDAASRLYLWRYWNYEWVLSHALLDLARQETPFDMADIRTQLARYFPESGDTGKVNRQKVAVLVALKGCLSIITGGPGTGKTTVVSRILAMLHQQDPKLKIALAAPTGKAAQRLEEALGRTIRDIDTSGDGLRAMQFRASTIHRLLGMVPARSRTRFSQSNPLPYDVVVVDEASMTPLSLMAKLVQALKPGARLMLVGDRNQLASVEPGHVLGDICGAGSEYGYSENTCRLIREATGYNLNPGNPKGVMDCLVELKDTYRFREDSGIRQLGEAVREGDAIRCLDTARQQGYQDVRVRDIDSMESLAGFLRPSVSEGYASYLKAAAVEDRFSHFGRFRVLCALREGPFGVMALNRLIEKTLAEKGFIRPEREHYHGRPVIITANDYGLRLFNGDIGIILRDDPDGDLKCFFPSPGQRVRKISVLRLPEHETAYAMTVHKSQGSEFDSVVLLLPPKDSPVLTRELVYTGITRARERIELWITPEIFAAAVQRRTERTSGLGDLLLS